MYCMAGVRASSSSSDFDGLPLFSYVVLRS